MSTQPRRRRLEPGIIERLGADGERLGLEVIFKDGSGRTRRRTVHGGIQEARDALARARTRRVRRAAEPADPRVTFNSVCDAFEAAHVAGLRLNSRQAYAAPLRRLRARFGERRLSSITKADVRSFVAVLRAAGLKANTIRAHTSALSAVYTFARDDLDAPVVMPRLKPSERPTPSDDEREHRILTDDELARVLAACGERSRLFFRTLAETGARKSEGLGLTPRRIDAGAITIAEQLDERGALAPLKTSRRKGGARRVIAATRALTAELRLAAGARVFEHLTHDIVDAAWSKALKAAGLADPQPVIHDLRHSHASALIADGWDPQAVADRLGDRLETVLRVYAHAFESRRAAAAQRDALEARYGDGMATDKRQQAATDAMSAGAEPVDLRAIRDGRR